MSSFQPSTCSYTGLAASNSVSDRGTCSRRTPSISYATHTFTLGRPERTSSLVSATPASALRRLAYRTTGASNQPHRRGRPVVDPYSFPRSRIFCPSSSNSSVGNGPPPTRVAYAFDTPMTPPIFVGPTPDPVHAPPAVVFEEVTNGYVPWSMSSSVPWAPSNSSLAPRPISPLMKSEVSMRWDFRRSPYAIYSSNVRWKGTSSPPK